MGRNLVPAGQPLGRLFVSYVSHSVLGTLGYSCYVLVDTYFISVSTGAAGITVLNLSIPLYSFLFAIGAMVGIGSSIRFALAREMRDKRQDLYFSTAFFVLLGIGLAASVLGFCWPGGLLYLMGGRGRILILGTPYVRTFMLFSPFFLLSYLFTGFVRNDGAPTLAMAATICSSLFNCVFDYIFIFPLRMGLFGAALATAISPVVSMAICLIHLLSKKSHVRFVWRKPSARLLLASCQLGVPSFIAQFSSGIITTVCNLLLLRLSGETSVAAYGIVTNLAIVASALFEGIQSGMQPITSSLKGQGRDQEAARALRMGLLTAAGTALLVYIVTFAGTDLFIGIFNHERNPRTAAELGAMAHWALRLYFLGYFFSSVNIVEAGYLASVGEGGASGVISIARGCVLVVAFAFFLAAVWGLPGVFAAFPAAELATTVLIAGWQLLVRLRRGRLSRV